MNDDEQQFADLVASELFGITPDFEIKQRSDGPFFMLLASSPSERLFQAVARAQEKADETNIYKTRATVAKRRTAPRDRLGLPEARLFRTTISESLTVDRYSFGTNFFDRYIRSVSKVEDQVVGDNNFLVYGRRGSGKTSLLAYAMHVLARDGTPFAWVSLQAFRGRSDVMVSVDVLADIFSQVLNFRNTEELETATSSLCALRDLSDERAREKLERLIPQLRKAIGPRPGASQGVTIFLDDIHVIGLEYQRQLLSDLYAICRGNMCYVKVAGIEQFSKPWLGSTQSGMQPGHDIQVLKLDYNLTTPDKSREHIESILDAHAKFCGLPSIRYLAGPAVISRLTWAAAAVPRDALNLFVTAMAKASAKRQTRVSVTSVNESASEVTEQKLQEINDDSSEEQAVLREVLEDIKNFCIKEKGTNAFLVEIRNDSPLYGYIQDLIALRLVHVLSEGITPHEAGRRYIAVMLDYGFYVGVRAARRVSLFLRDPKVILAKSLRKLPILSPAVLDNE